jgi:hypothetical protein
MERKEISMKKLLLTLLFPLTAHAQYVCQVCEKVTPVPTATATATPTPAAPSIPLALYDSNAKKYGAQNCTRLKTYTAYSDTAFNDTYYDAAWIFQQFAARYSDTSWLDCVAAANKVYNDFYLVPAAYRAPGYHLFPHGLPRDAYLKLKANGLFVNASAYNDTYQGGDQAWYAIRETAYALMTHLREPTDTTRIAQLKGYLFKALDQTWVAVTPNLVRKPFMSALAAQALIEYSEKIAPNAGILPRLKAAADGIWKMKTADGLQYSDSATEGTYSAPDLNLLIAPLYYWVYRQTGDVKYRDEGDFLFTQGVTVGLNLSSGKQFNQNYRWSIKGLGWRG